MRVYILFASHISYSVKKMLKLDLYVWPVKKKMNVYAQPVWVKNEISTLHLGFL